MKTTIILLITSVFSLTVMAADWPQYGGPDGKMRHTNATVYYPKEDESASPDFTQIPDGIRIASGNQVDETRFMGDEVSLIGTKISQRELNKFDVDKSDYLGPFPELMA